MILTHYYHEDDRPFQTLSSLSDEAALKIISSFKERTGAVYQRFRNPLEYLSQRRETENWIRDEFVKQGGQPLTKYPQYFTIGQAVWIEDGYNGKNKIIQIPLSAFHADRISFTYPDSMISYWLKNQAIDTNYIQSNGFYHPEYHGKVFRLTAIYEVIRLFGIPEKQWQTDMSRKYDIFIEAQVWEDIKI
jgi:ribosomal protein L21E